MTALSGVRAIASAIERIPENKLFFADKLYDELFRGQFTEEAYDQALDHICKTGALCQPGRGIYYRPQRGKYGPVPLSQSEIISVFTEEERGAIIGYAMYNQLKLTTQVPKVVEVLSSKAKERPERIGNVSLQFCNLKYTTEVINALCMLEVLQNFEAIQELNYYQFRCLCKEFSTTYSDRAMRQVVVARPYKKRTLAFLKKVLDYYGVLTDLC